MICDVTKIGTVVATIAGGNMSLGGVDNDRKVVVYHGVGVFTKDNYKPSTIATTTTATATTTGVATVAKAIVTKPSRPRPTTTTVTNTDDGPGPDAVVNGGDGANVIGVDGNHEGKIQEGDDEEGEVSSPSKGKNKTTGGALTMSIGTLTDAW